MGCWKAGFVQGVVYIFFVRYVSFISYIVRQSQVSSKDRSNIHTTSSTIRLKHCLRIHISIHVLRHKHILVFALCQDVIPYLVPASV